MYEQQATFYHKFVRAVRETGYRGVIVGSCWQAGAGLAHWYNLHTDYLAGAIDRHNYFGGGKGHHLQPGPFDPAAMVSSPGSGLLGTGLQQVSDRPFQLSEWMSLIPTEWTAEAAPIIAAYGLGLQGWDASLSFAMDQPAFTGTVHTPGVYNVTAPTHLTLYPALASMIYRGDVREGQPVADRRINLTELASGKRRYVENVVQDFDRKSFDGEVPAAALAERVQEFIETRFAERLTIDHLADRFALGRRNLERRFKKATDNTVIEYIQRVKIEAAKKAFESTWKTIYEIMDEVGYADVRAFREVFRRLTGLSPTDYRNRYNRAAVNAGDLARVAREKRGPLRA